MLKMHIFAPLVLMINGKKNSMIQQLISHFTFTNYDTDQKLGKQFGQIIHRGKMEITVCFRKSERERAKTITK